MNEVKLTDFTKEELKAAALVMMRAVNDHNYSEKEREAFALWETQLINACAVVSLREKTIMN